MQRKVYILRSVDGLSWNKIALKVKNRQGERPFWQVCRDAFKKFSIATGRATSKYDRCGRKPVLTQALRSWLVRRLRSERKKGLCTSTTLQRDLVRAHGVTVEASTIRRALLKEGYQWLRRSKKPKYNAKDRRAREAFADKIADMTLPEMKRAFHLSLDGVILTRPPKDPTARENWCRTQETHVWRKSTEAALPELAGHDSYAKQVPLSRAVPLWGGISWGGFVPVLWHNTKKVKAVDWAEVVRSGAFVASLLSVNPGRTRGPWKVLCDNETFLGAKASKAAYRRENVEMVHIPSKSPDLNPVEKFWAWLRKRLRLMDLGDLRAKRPVLGKTAFKARVKRVVKTAAAKRVAANCMKDLLKVAKMVKESRGH